MASSRGATGRLGRKAGSSWVQSLITAVARPRRLIAASALTASGRSRVSAFSALIRAGTPARSWAVAGAAAGLLDDPP